MLFLIKDLSAQLIIISDGSWKSDINLVPGWETVGFSDTAWVNATSPAPYGCTPVISGTQTMWWSNSNVTDVYFRKSFHLYSNITSGTAEITADNEFYLYLNGAFVGTGNSWSNFYSFNIEPYLQCGLNVFAIRGIEWVPGTCNLVTFKVTINTTSSSTLSLVPASTPALCSACNGSASVSASGGSGTYFFSWSSGQTSQTATGLCAGVYTVTVTDNGCNTSTISITVPGAGGITAGIQISTKIPCNGQCNGTVAALVNNGTSPYTYLWNNGQTDMIANGLCAGSYMVTVSDANNCSAVSLVIITEPAILSFSSSFTKAGCYSQDGTATVSMTGGTFPYFYLWSDGQTSATATGLGPGNYMITLSDAYGCTDSTYVIITSLIPPTITIDSITNVTCHGQSNGSVNISVSGSFPFTYSWSPNGETDAMVSGLNAGIYNVIVTDNNGCVQTQSVTITEPPPLVLNFKRNYYTCAEGSGPLQLTASGGTTYRWCPAAGLNDSTIANPQAFVLANTTYTVTVSDGPCSDTAHVNIFLIPPPPPPTISLSGDTLFILHSYSDYQWFLNGNPLSGATDFFYIAIQDGNYAVMITDSIGCRSLSSGVLFTHVNGLIDNAPISIHPNPIGSSFKLQRNTQEKDAEVIINDILGNEIIRKVMSGERIEIERGNMVSGVYFLRVRMEERQWVQKIVVE